MAQGRHEHEYDEFDALMFQGEVPNVTFWNQRCEELRMNRPSSWDVPGNFKNMNNGFQQNHFVALPEENMKLPDDQLLASAFANCNLGYEFPKEAFPSTNFMTIPNTESRGSTLLSAQTQSIASRVSDELNGANSGLQNAGNYFNAGWLMNDGIGFGFGSGLPSPVDIQSFPVYSHPQHVNQSPLWRDMEEEQLMLEQRNLYRQLHDSQQFDTQDLIHANHNMVSGLMNQSRGHYLQSHGVPRLLDQSRLGLPYGDLDSSRVLGKIERQPFPGKLLKRPNGLSSLRAMKLGSVPGNESLNSGGPNGKYILNSQVSCNSWDPDNGFFQLGSSTPRLGPFSNTNSLREVILPEEYDRLDEVRGCIYRLAKDQDGCRFLQKMFSGGRPKEVEIIFHEVLKHSADLMVDPFGNYLVQKLLQVCNENQTTQILRMITRRPGDLIRISCDMHGTRAVQKVLQILTTPEQFSVAVASLKPGMATLMKNTNGNHVAQCCLEHLPPKYREFLFEVAAENCVDLATDRHGCCVIQRCLGHPGGEQRRRLIHEIALNSLIISQNQFGNYVIQYVLIHIPEAVPDVLSQLEGHFVELSMQKYSSNVVEKCIEHADEEHRRRIVEELFTSPELDQIMQDPYGNYVTQAAVNNSKGAVKAAVVDAIKLHVHVLQSSPYGKKVLSCSSLKNLYWCRQ